MLTFEEKQQIIESFPELTKKEVSMKRINYHYEDSLYEKTIVVQHLHPNGNGFVYVANVQGYSPDERGLVNIRDASKEELVQIVKDAIAGLSVVQSEAIPTKQLWQNEQGVELELLEEDQFWNLYFGENLEEGFGDYEEAVTYLQEEGFSQKNKG